jgi:hypothetical protein
MRSHQLSCGTLLILVSICGSGRVSGAEFISIEYEFSFSYPEDTWEPPTQVSKPGKNQLGLFVTEAKDGKRTFTVMLVPDPFPLTGDSLTKFKKGFVEASAGLISERRCQLSGQDAYELIVRAVADGVQVVTLNRFTNSGPYTYGVSAGVIGNDLPNDAELDQMMNSFRLTNPRPISGPNTTGQDDPVNSVPSMLTSVIVILIVLGLWKWLTR